MATACYSQQGRQSASAAVTASDFNRLVVDVVPDLSDVFPPPISFDCTNILDEKTELEQVIDFIEGIQSMDEGDVVANKLNRQVRISQCKRIWDLKLERARTEEKYMNAGKMQLEVEIAQVKRNKDFMEFKVHRDIPSDKARMRYGVQVMKAAGKGGEKPFEEALENLTVAEKELIETLPSFDIRLDKITVRLNEVKQQIEKSKESQATAVKLIRVIQNKWTNGN